jgi:hypothetical protein
VEQNASLEIGGDVTIGSLEAGEAVPVGNLKVVAGSDIPSTETVVEPANLEMGGVVEAIGSETRGLCGITAVGTTKEEVAPPAVRPVVRQEAAAVQVVFIHIFIIKKLS